MFRELRALAHFGVLILSAIFAVAQHSSTISADQTWNDLALIASETWFFR